MVGSGVLVVVRVVLAAVFGVAAVAKFADRPGTRRSLVEFGLPSALVGIGAVLLPLAELAIALALLPAATARLAAWGAVALLLVFLAAIAHHFARGRRPDCHCFGQLHSEPIGWSVIGRNGVLLGLAASVVLVPGGDAGPGVLAWLLGLTSFEQVVTLGGAAVLVVLVIQAVTLRTVLAHQRAITQRLDDVNANANAPAAGPKGTGKAMGSAAPDFSLPSLDDGVVTLTALRQRGRPVVLIFADPNCGPCDAMLPQIAAWQKGHADVVTLALVTRGTLEANRSKGTDHGVRMVLVESDREVSETFGVWGTPSAVMVRADGTIGSQLAQAEGQIRELMDSVVGMAAASVPLPPPPPLPAPSASMPVPPAAASVAAPVAATAGVQPAEPPPARTLNGGFRPMPSPTITLDLKLNREACVQEEDLPEGGTVLYNGCRRQVLTLNGTAALVWEYCDGEADIRTIIAEVQSVFPAAAEVDLDVRNVVQQLLDAGMVSSADS